MGISEFSFECRELKGNSSSHSVGWRRSKKRSGFSGIDREKLWFLQPKFSNPLLEGESVQFRKKVVSCWWEPSPQALSSSLSHGEEKKREPGNEVASEVEFSTKLGRMINRGDNFRWPL